MISDEYLALLHSTPEKPKLLVIGGPAGVGKTTLAGRLVQCGWTHVPVDDHVPGGDVHAVNALPAEERCAAWGEAYAAAFACAQELLPRACPVLDGSFLDAARRVAALDVARTAPVRAGIVLLDDERGADRRNRARSRPILDASSAGQPARLLTARAALDGEGWDHQLVAQRQPGNGWTCAQGADFCGLLELIGTTLP